MKATFFKYQLQFKQASGTSRGVLTSKDTWFLKIQDANQMGIGECGMFRGLSCDDRPDFADKLDWVCENIKLGQFIDYFNVFFNFCFELSLDNMLEGVNKFKY